jgi:DNA-binding response OmpR family regulator
MLPRDDYNLVHPVGSIRTLSVLLSQVVREVMKSILYVDSDRVMCDNTQTLLKKFGFDVETMCCIQDAYHRAENTAFSLIMVELSIGKDHGTTLIRQLRALGIITPIVVYTEYDTESYELSAFGAGADDYILKSTSIPRLLARIHAHLDREDRQEKRRPSTQRRIPIGRYVLDRQAHVIEGDGKVLKLTEIEMKVLDLLSMDFNRIYPVPEILEKVWGRDFRKSEDRLHAAVKRLRKKLEDQCGVKRLVETYHGRGFKLNEEAVAQEA